jgi:hypothetical protein
MKLSHRAYPYPVVGNGDDVVDVAFQAPIEVHRDGINYYLKVNIQCSSKTINRLVAKGDAVLSCMSSAAIRCIDQCMNSLNRTRRS